MKCHTCNSNICSETILNQIKAKYFKAVLNNMTNLSKYDGSRLEDSLDWLPDWTEESQYIDGELLSHTQWTWEFLRRSEEYRKLWYSSINAKNVDRGQLCGAMRITLARRGNGELRIRNPRQVDEYFEDIAVKFNEKFRLEVFPPDPSDNAPDIRFESVSIFTSHGPKEFQLNESQFLCLVDLQMNLDDQIKNLKRRLAVIQGNRIKLEATSNEANNAVRRARRGEYKEYLRIIDALLSNCSVRQIAEELHSLIVNEDGQRNGERRVYEQIEIAMDLQKNCYKFLPFKDHYKKVKITP